MEPSVAVEMEPGQSMQQPQLGRNGTTEVVVVEQTSSVGMLPTRWFSQTSLCSIAIVRRTQAGGAGAASAPP